MERIVKSSFRSWNQRRKAEYSLHIVQRIVLSGHYAASIHHRNCLEGRIRSKYVWKLFSYSKWLRYIFQIPVCEKDVDKGIHEEKLWRSKIADKCLNNDDESIRKEILGTALKLFAVISFPSFHRVFRNIWNISIFFQLCCQTSHEVRAFELCEFVDQPKFTELALKYSSRARNDLLVDKLSQLQAEQARNSEEDKNEFDFAPR